MEEKLKSKYLYKILLCLIKYIPMMFAFMALLTLITSYLGYETPIMSYIGGVSIITLILLYMLSYVFRFCNYHRIFIHYVAINYFLNLYDYHIGFPIEDKPMFMIYLMLAIIIGIIALYLKFK